MLLQSASSTDNTITPILLCSAIPSQTSLLWFGRPSARPCSRRLCHGPIPAPLHPLAIHARRRLRVVHAACSILATLVVHILDVKGVNMTREVPIICVSGLLVARSCLGRQQIQGLGGREVGIRTREASEEC